MSNLWPGTMTEDEIGAHFRVSLEVFVKSARDEGRTDEEISTTLASMMNRLSGIMWVL